MKKDEYDFVDVSELRTGLFVDLELGWMDHPFPMGRFKISSAKQIEVLRSLGLRRIRVVPSRSTPADVITGTGHTAALDAAEALANTVTRSSPPSAAQLLSEQHRLLTVCERRFNESVRFYRKVVEQIADSPKELAQQCADMVGGYVKEFMEDSVSSIRLLTEAAGDKASMHPVNVTVLSLLLGKALGLSRTELVDLGVASFLHDIGKSKIPASARWPSENFSNAEKQRYQEHVMLGTDIGKSMNLSIAALLAIEQHHEMADGSGFPGALVGDSMSVSGRILALVNRYDNLCNPGRQGLTLTPHEALALIFAQQKARFDSHTLSAFIRMMGVYPPGSVVQLIDDRYAMVVSVNSARPLKPKVILHEPKVPPQEALILDLEQAPSTGIRRSLKPSVLPPAVFQYLAPRQQICYFFEPLSGPYYAQTIQ